MSGTGNMKLMMNGAITIGTRDGANIEILDAVGADNFFLFGLDTDGVEAMRANYDPQSIIAAEPDLREVMGLLTSGHFNQGGMRLRNRKDETTYKVRRGKVGGFRDYFTPGQVAELEQIVAARLSPRFGYFPGAAGQSGSPADNQGSETSRAPLQSPA